ncbi:MAG: pilus assembly protein PilM [Thermodesulfobacteriota bacterium]
MATEEEISSTEKLLNVIRSSHDGTAPAPGNTSKQNFWGFIKENWLPSGSRGVTGVEIFRDTLNIVRMNREKSGWRAVYAARTVLPEGLSPDHADFPLFLKTQLRNADPAGRTEIWACLPPSRGDTWNVLVPKVKKGLTNAVYWTARKERAFDDQEYYFDYRVKDEVNDKGIWKLSVQVCIASARHIDLYRKVFAEAGYSLNGVTLPAFSLENLFARQWIDPGEESYAALYIGEDSSYIEIHGRRTTLFNRVIKTGRDSILDSLAMKYSQNESEPELQEAEAAGDRQKAAQILKQQAGLSEKNLFEMIQPAMERLARQLERTIDHSVNVLENPAPERIYICGGISFLPGIADFFSEQLGVGAVIMDVPREQTATSGIFPDRDERLCLVSTAGLAMVSKDTVNFLHTAVDMDREKKALRNANIVAAMCALLFVATAVWWWSARYELEQVREETAALEKQLEQFSPRLTADDLAELAGKLQEKKKELGDYSRNLLPVAVLTEINRLTPEGVELLSVRLENTKPGSGTNDQGPPVLIVDGFIRSDQSMEETRLTGYLLQLRRSPILMNPSIADSSPDTLDTGEDVYRFTLNMEIQQV